MLSVIIPTLDEAARIGALLDELAATPGIHEVIVVDGGSRDGTPGIASSRSGVRVVAAPRGRARQMNRGAAEATGDVLLFLHADVSLCADAVAHVQATLAEPGVVAGAFRIRTVADSGPHWMSPLLRAADLRSRYTSLPYGDQALFVRAAAFRAVGGFPDVALMEDYELARRLWRVGRIRTVPAEVRVSGRRFLAHPLRALVEVNVLPLLYRLGVPSHVVARWYGRPR